MRILNPNPLVERNKDLSLDVLAPLRGLVLRAISSQRGTPYIERLVKLLPNWEARIFCGGIAYNLPDDKGGAVLFIQTDSDVNWIEDQVVDYCRMLCFGGSRNLRDQRDAAYQTSAQIRDCIVSILRPTVKTVSVNKMIYSIGIGSDRTRLDVGSNRPYSDIELTVISNIRRFE